MSDLLASLLLFALLFMLPLAIAAARYRLRGNGHLWRVADRSSIGHLQPAHLSPEAVVRIFAARTVRWRGILATHCWIVFKPEEARSYTRYDYTAWGNPIRMNGFEPDGRWFGQDPEVVLAADGPAAALLIPHVQEAIRTYAHHEHGSYRAWPGPNSNTFIAAILMPCRACRWFCRRPRSARTTPMMGVGCAAPPHGPASSSPSAAMPP